VLYKVTPMLTPALDAAKKVKAPRDPNAPKEPRKRRKSAVYDAEGNEVLITMMCLKCRAMKPLTMFGLRKMADGAIRNQPWCRTCRSGAGTPKPKKDAPVAEAEETTSSETELPAAEAASAAAAPAAVAEAPAAPEPV
jgi:hypothetical protein